MLLQECINTYGDLSQRTLCFLVEDNKVLLGYKKTGFGKGKWVGIGGKIEDGESMEQAMIRESTEEIGVKPLVYSKLGVLNYYFPEQEDSSSRNQSVGVYVVTEREGSIEETEEIRPERFSMDSIPFDTMRDDASYRLGDILTGKDLTANFSFDTKLLVKEYSII